MKIPSHKIGKTFQKASKTASGTFSFVGATTLLTIAVIASTALPACSTTPLQQTPPKTEQIFVTTPLPLPERPKLEKLTQEDLESIPENVLDKLEKRDQARRDYCEVLETIIKSTHTPSDK